MKQKSHSEQVKKVAAKLSKLSKALRDKSTPRTVEQFRQWAERQSEITANMSKDKIDRYIDARTKVNNQIEKQIEKYKDEIRKLYERIKRNEIQTEKDVNELHNIFGDPF